MRKQYLPTEIHIQQEALGKRYIFPKRDLRGIRGLGIILLLVGLFVTTFMFFWMYTPIKDAFTEDGVARWFMLFFGLLGLPGLGIGLAMIAGAIAVLSNNTHSEIYIDDSILRSTEYVGFLRWHRKRKLSDIHQLVLGDGVMTSTNGNTGVTKTSYPLGRDASCIYMGGADMKDMMILPAYPKEIAKAFAEFLSNEVIPESSGASRKIEVQEEEDIVEEALPEPTIEKPKDSTTVYQKLDAGCTLTIPPVGLLKGSKGLFFFGIIWNLFMTVFTVAFISGMSKGKANDIIPAIAFISFFWLIGTGLMLGAINMGRRKALIAVVGDTLGIRRTSIFGTKEIKASITSISDIRMAASGTEVNDVPVMELKIFSSDLPKGKVGILSQLSNDELEWIAYTLRKETGIC